MFVYDAIYLADDVVFTSQLYIAPKYTEKYNAFTIRVIKILPSRVSRLSG